MSREAMQMALHTLEGWANYGKWVWPESALEQAKRNTTESIAALRQALEEKQKTAVSPGKGTGFNYFRASPITVLRQPQEPVGRHEPEPTAWVRDQLQYLVAESVEPDEESDK